MFFITCKVKYTDNDGKEHIEDLDHMPSRVFQHEFDHMEGTNFTKKVSKLKLKMAQKRVQKQLKKVNRIKDLA